MSNSAVTTNLYSIFLSCSGVSTDTRNITPGALFFALHGANFDGNRFAVQALDKGASLAVVDDPRVAVSDRYLIVENTLLALQHLAAHHRRQLGIPIIAITGTNGKTTTKELTARVLARRFRVSVTEGNLNNHIGVPLTLLRMTRATELGIVEMGANAPGEIATLCTIAAPGFGIITNVGMAHLEGFGSFEGVKRAKGELYDYLAAHGGTAFVLADDLQLTVMASERPDMRKVEYSADGLAHINSALAGSYNRYNIAAAAAVGRYFGIPEKEIEEAIGSYMPDNMRSQKTVTAKNTLILDCYNANPSSMRAAITDFAGTPLCGVQASTTSNDTSAAGAGHVAVTGLKTTDRPCTDTVATGFASEDHPGMEPLAGNATSKASDTVMGAAGHNTPGNMANDNTNGADSSCNKLLILGDMLELGDYSAGEHLAIIELLYDCGLRDFYLVGSHFMRAAKEFFRAGNTPPAHKFAFPDTDSLKSYLVKNPIEGKSILIKASRGIGLDKVVDLL